MPANDAMERDETMTESAVRVEMENLSEVKRRLIIEVPLSEVAEEVERSYRDLGKRVKVKGFRPGKVPRAVLEMYYHKEIDKEVSDALVRRSLGEALKEKDLKPHSLSLPCPGHNYPAEPWPSSKRSRSPADSRCPHQFPSW